MELIQMRATREEVESLGIELINKTSADFVHYEYLKNQEDGTFYMGEKSNRKTYETFNKEIFLKACDMEEKFEVTKEDIVMFASWGDSKNADALKQRFPECFKVELKVGEWYKTKSNCLFKLNEITDNFYLGYGFTESTTYYSELREYIRTELKPATNEEVFEALKNEAVKRGFEAGTYFNSLDVDYAICNKVAKVDSVPDYDTEKDCLYTMNGVIYENGKWATIIPTLTKKEAEEKFNIKIKN